MKRNKLNKILEFFLVCLVVLSQSLCFVNFTQATSEGLVPKASYQPDELLVKFSGESDVQKIKLTAGSNIDQLVESYKNNPLVDFVEPNYTFKISAFPSDPYYNRQTFFDLVNGRQAWSDELLIRENEGISSRAIIAVLDTGVDLDHPDLVDKIWINRKEKNNNQIDDDRNGYTDDVHGWDFVNNDNDPNPDFSSGYDNDSVNHGTIVAGIAAASSQNSQGVSGAAWFADIMPLRVLDSQGSGSVYNVIRAINYAVDNGADVINMSFFGVGFSQALHDAIQEAYKNGVVLVAAAGNTDPAINGFDLDLTKSYPVCYDGSSGQNFVIGVASVDQNLHKSNFSNYGGCIDIVAPGEKFFSTQVYRPDQPGFTDYYNGYWSGTSVSAPLVSGVVAEIKALRPELGVNDLQDIVLNTAKNIDNLNPRYKSLLGHGLLDYSAAINAAVQKKVSKSSGGQGNYIIAGLGYGSFPQLKILNDNGQSFKEFFAYSPYFKGAINVASGDVNNDQKSEVVTGAGFGGGPQIRVFNSEGIVLSQFFAGDKNLRNGINVAVGDINGDGQAEIITGAGVGSQPEVKVFDFKGNLQNSFLAYSKTFLGGVSVAVGDINGDGQAEIITGAGPGGGPHIRIFKADGQVVSQFFAFNQYFNGGVNVASGDVNGDSIDEILVGVASKSSPLVKIFTATGAEISSIFAYEPNFFGGVNVAAGDLDNDGLAEIITGKGKGGLAEINVFDLHGRTKYSFNAYNSILFGGVRVGFFSK